MTDEQFRQRVIEELTGIRTAIQELNPDKVRVRFVPGPLMRPEAAPDGGFERIIYDLGRRPARISSPSVRKITSFPLDLDDAAREGLLTGDPPDNAFDDDPET